MKSISFPQSGIEIGQKCENKHESLCMIQKMVQLYFCFENEEKLSEILVYSPFKRVSTSLFGKISEFISCGKSDS